MMSGPPLVWREITLPLSVVLAVFGLLWWFLSGQKKEQDPEVRDGAAPHLQRQPVGRPDYLWAISLAVAFYLLGLWRLAAPNVQYFDEVHHVRSAGEYVEGLEPHEWTHPPIAKLLIAGSLKAWQASFDPRDGVWKDANQYPDRSAVAWRFPSLVFGSLAVLFQFALARSLLGNRSVAIAAAALLALDGLFFVHSRIGMTNIITVCLMLMGTLGTWQYVRYGTLRWLLLAGFGLGCAIATRWTSLFIWGFNGLILIWHLVTFERKRWAEKGVKPLVGVASWVVKIGLTMVVLPLVLYFMAYIPYVLMAPGDDWRAKVFSSGEPTSVLEKIARREFYAQGHGWYKVLTQQKDMWRYHAGIKESHPYSSPWWSWPLVLRPTWYHFQSVDGNVIGVWGIGNVFLWWATLPALVFSAVLAWRERAAPLGVLALFGLGLWLVWGVEPRSLIFMHYLLETIPWACMALAYFGYRLWVVPSQNEDPAAPWWKRETMWRRLFVVTYASLIAFWFVFFYPLLSAYPVSDSYFRMHLWLGRRWI